MLSFDLQGTLLSPLLIKIAFLMWVPFLHLGYWEFIYLKVLKYNSTIDLSGYCGDVSLPPTLICFRASHSIGS